MSPPPLGRVASKSMKLRIPTVLAFTVTATIACDGGGKHPDAQGPCNGQPVCVYSSVDNGNCPFPTCATGSNFDVCPEGCIPEPLT